MSAAFTLHLDLPLAPPPPSQCFAWKHSAGFYFFSLTVCLKSEPLALNLLFYEPQKPIQGDWKDTRQSANQHIN